MEFTTNRRKSEFSCIRSVTARYPCEVSVWGLWKGNVAHNLFLAILHTRYKVDGFHVSNIDFVSQDVGKDDFSYVPGTPSRVNIWRSDKGTCPYFFFW